MQITFGMFLDGSEWSDAPASAGIVQLGPEGMLSLLETHLGLTGIHAHPAKRIAQYMSRMEEADHQDQYYHASFHADRWSAAKQLLALRDELIACGWDGSEHPQFTPRLRSLAALEQSSLPLDEGREDRQLAVMEHLKQGLSVPIEKITLHDLEADFPIAWQHILSQLRQQGVEVTQAPGDDYAANEGNLQLLQRTLQRKQAGEVIRDDESLLLLRTDTEWDAAETLARWLKADEENNHGVAIIAGSDTGVLDLALHRLGLPAVGRSDSSAWRSILQVLPLVLANAWKPIDIHRLTELLALPRSPIHNADARTLLQALREEPGIGGREWQKALKEIEQNAAARAEERGKSYAAARGREIALKLDALLRTNRFDPTVGIQEDELLERCNWVRHWLNAVIESGHLSDEERDIYQEARAHASELIGLITGSGSRTRVEIERMLDSVIGLGARAADRCEEAAPWEVVRHPGQITRPVDVLIWWDFIDRGDNHAQYWSESERRALEAENVFIPALWKRRDMESKSWRRGFSHAARHVLLFSPSRKNLEFAYPHPFWDEILAAAYRHRGKSAEKDIQSWITRDGRNLVSGGKFMLAGRSMSLVEAAPQPIRKPASSLSIDGASISAPQHLSYSQLNSIISCPARWVMEKHLRLRSADVLTLPTGNRMIGTMCHRIVELMYEEPGTKWEEAAAENRAMVLFDELVPAMAAELLMEGRKVEHDRLRVDAGRAVRLLVAEINRLQLTVESTEAVLEGIADGIPFMGRVDMLLRTPGGEAFVLDLKWTNSSKYHRTTVIEGRALQLSTYTWLLRERGEGEQPMAGYFMLAQGEILSDAAMLGDRSLESEISLNEIWERGVRSWKRDFNLLQTGTLEVRGVMERERAIDENTTEDGIREIFRQKANEEDTLYLEPCAFCDFGIVCGMKEGEA